MRNKLIAELARYTPADPKERADISYISDLLAGTERAFWRDCFPDHMTGSGLVVSATGDKVLLNHHKSLDKWLCFGGHADGDEDIRAVAMRECVEESGLSNLTFLFDGIVDVDRHLIPANAKKNEPAHYHCDIRFVVQAENDDFTLSDESNALRWCTVSEALELVHDMTMRRLIRKWADKAGIIG